MGSAVEKCELCGVNVYRGMIEHSAVCGKGSNIVEMYFHPGELVYIRDNSPNSSNQHDSIAQTRRQWTCCGRLANDTSTRGCTIRT